MTSSTIEVHGLSHLGNVRVSNQDAMTWDLDLGFVAVADGMGGHQAGDVAASLALDAILGFIRKSAATNDFTWPFGVNPRLSLSANRLATAIKIGNRRVFKRSEEEAEYVGMGTTVVALVVDRPRVTFASVGDSRIYAFKDGALRQLTRDDSWVVMLAEERGVTPETLREHPMRNVLTSVVGARPELEIQTAEIELHRETLLLCSDGLHTSLSSEEITAVLAAESDLQRAAKSLIEIALEKDGKDNITAVLVRLTGTD